MLKTILFCQIQHEQVRKEELSKVMILVSDDIVWQGRKIIGAYCFWD
jgi:hypothetical protein